ncbi:hypothetical protein [Flavobacterium sp. 3HN19-14]|uniref:hypothetical protein n=1 Tax=Flavobacterium sp. 3HN19-14 TaxID=3448133 RepID=UPI003EDECA6A
MRKLLFFFAILVTNIIMAQAPQGLNYQAVVRSASGTLMTNQSVTFKMSIIKNTAASDAVYAETHTVQTDDLGQVNFVIGQGNTGFVCFQYS